MLKIICSSLVELTPKYTVYTSDKSSKCQKACKNDPGKEEKGVKNRPTLTDVRDLLQEKKLEEAGKGCWEWRQYAK
jgi:hypothetical protein